MNGKSNVCLTWIVFACMLLSVYSEAPVCPVRRILTFNTALLDMALHPSNVNNRPERTVAITDELRKMNVDVVCLQEVWLGEDVEYLTKSLRNVYPFSFSKLHYKGQVPPQYAPRPPPCTTVVAKTFFQCLRRNKCMRKRLSQQDKLLCAVSRCFIEYVYLPQKCMSCVVVTGFTNPKETFAKCVGPGVPVLGMRDVNEPGLVLLSKTPLYNTRFVDFHPKTKESIERGYLEADSNEFGKIVCTHTTHSEPLYQEPELWVDGVFNSYEEQGNSERGQLIKRFQNVSPLLLMGDFNIGDSFGPGVSPEQPRAFRVMASVFNVVPLDECTMCQPGNNPYFPKSRSRKYKDTVVDHIFFKGHQVTHVVRVFEPVQAILLNGLTLSDHYGVMAFMEMC